MEAKRRWEREGIAGVYPAHSGSVAQYLQIKKATWEQYKTINPFDKTTA